MNSPVPLDLQAKIALWRQRAATGDLTEEEMREAVRYLREGRLAAATSAAAAKRKRAIAAIPSAADLLGGMEDL